MASKFGNITRDQILASLGDEEQDPIVPASPLLSELPKKKPKFNFGFFISLKRYDLYKKKFGF